MQASAPSEFLRQFAVDPALRSDPVAQARHARLTSRASVCTYCGVGCSYTVVAGDEGMDRILPLSPLGLCVKRRDVTAQRWRPRAAGTPRAPRYRRRPDSHSHAIWIGSLYKLAFRPPTFGANSEHCLAGAGAAQQETETAWRKSKPKSVYQDGD